MTMRQKRGYAVIGPDGTEYVSMAAAARALGVSHGCVKHHKQKYGDLNQIGSSASVYLWRGKKYQGIKALTAAAGVSRTSVFRHLRRHGNLDRLSNVRGGQPGNLGLAKTTTIGPHSWPSRRIAAAALRVNYDSFRRWMRSLDDPASRERILAAMTAYEARRCRVTPTQSNKG